MKMDLAFNGANLRLARVFHGFSLDDLAGQVDKSRQYLHKLETNQGEPTPSLATGLAAALKIHESFLYRQTTLPLTDENVHFRKLFTTRSVIKQVAMAKAEMFMQLVAYLDSNLKLPEVSIPSFPNLSSPEEIEQAAESCRRHWGLGLGPIDNMVRVAERAGALVTSFSSISAEVDALSFASKRPIIVRNEAKQSACRQRFDIAHELGHFVMHAGQQTGDRVTETQANRFGSSFLVPRSMMATHWPKLKGSRLDWIGIREFKMTWKVSKAALLYRARQLGLIDDNQYKSGVITLRRTGEASGEREDKSIPLESPRIAMQALQTLITRVGKKPCQVADDLGWSVELLEEIAGGPMENASTSSAEIISLCSYRRAG